MNNLFIIDYAEKSCHKIVIQIGYHTRQYYISSSVMVQKFMLIGRLFMVPFRANRLVLPLLLALIPGLLFAANDASLTAMATRLIALRGEVEELNNQLESKKSQHRNRMENLARQQGELEVLIHRENLRVKKLKKSLQKNKQLAIQSGAGDDQLQPVILKAIDELDRSLRGSLPFKIRERRSELAALRKQLVDGVLSAPKTVNRLWGFYEDEIRLTHENGLFKQILSVDGEPRLVQVARLGMVMMFFRTEDGRYGFIDRHDDNWRTVTVNDSRRQQIESLFDSLNRQIRRGYFEIPNALPNRLVSK